MRGPCATVYSAAFYADVAVTDRAQVLGGGGQDQRVLGVVRGIALFAQARALCRLRRALPGRG